MKCALCNNPRNNENDLGWPSFITSFCGYHQKMIITRLIKEHCDKFGNWDKEPSDKDIENYIIKLMQQKGRKIAKGEQ